MASVEKEIRTLGSARLHAKVKLVYNTDIMHQYNLVQIGTQDNILLNGLYMSGDISKSACIFIHGFTSDFYSHSFYHIIKDQLHVQSNALILAQTRGTGIQTEFIKPNDEGVFLGSYYEKLEDAHLDISAFVEFLIKHNYQKIVLIGHSLGTIKCVRYLFEGKYKDNISKVILLAPFDKNVLMEIKAPGKWREFLKIAQKKIADGKGKELVPVPEYEDYPLSYETFYSWYEQSDLGRMWDFHKKNYDFPVLQKIRIPVKVILGGKDPYVNYPQFDESAKSVLQTLTRYISNCETHLIPNSGHTYFGYEKEVADQVGNFVL